jgi:hypothetical protein
MFVFVFFCTVRLSESAANIKEKIEDNESKENLPPESGDSLNCESTKTDMVDNARSSQNGHDVNDKKKMYTQNKSVDKIAIDYPELGMADYGISRDSNARTTGNLNGYNSINSQGNHKFGPGSLNGLSPLNKSQIISRRLKLDLRNESEVPIAGNDNLNCIKLQCLHITKY